MVSDIFTVEINHWTRSLANVLEFAFFNISSLSIFAFQSSFFSSLKKEANLIGKEISRGADDVGKAINHTFDEHRSSPILVCKFILMSHKFDLN